jgi:hypothetical protein
MRAIVTPGQDSTGAMLKTRRARERMTSEEKRDGRDLSTRVTRLENAMAEMAEKVNILIDAQIKTESRFQETGKRIDKLVSAIGRTDPSPRWKAGRKFTRDMVPKLTAPTTIAKRKYDENKRVSRQRGLCRAATPNWLRFSYSQRGGDAPEAAKNGPSSSQPATIRRFDAIASGLISAGISRDGKHLLKIGFVFTSRNRILTDVPASAHRRIGFVFVLNKRP